MPAMSSSGGATREYRSRVNQSTMSTGRGPVKTLYVGVHFEEITKPQRLRQRSRQPTFISKEANHTGEKIMKRPETYKGSRRYSPFPPAHSLDI